MIKKTIPITTMAEDIIQLKKDLSDHELAVLNSEMEKYKKSTGLAYVLWFFFGTLGIHKFYIGKVKMGIFYLILGIVGWFSMISGIIAAGGPLTPVREISEAETARIGAGFSVFIICGVILGILLLIDLFTIPRQIRKRYEQEERKVVARIKGRPE